MATEPKLVERDERIVKLVNLAKEGNEDAKSEIFNNFKWFLRKYKNLLTDGPTHLNEKDVRHFMALYMSSKYRGILLSGKMNKESQGPINQKISELRGQYMELGKEDVESIVDLTFFQCLEVYDELGKVRKECRKHGIDYNELSKAQKLKWEKKFPPVGFEGFILNYFKYLLKKNLDRETKGVVPGIGWCQPLTSDEVDIDYVNEEHTEKDHYDIDYVIKQNITFSPEWVNGDAATWPFSELTKQERWLLKNRFEDKNYAIRLAEMTGYSATQIRKKINDIKIKLINIIKNQHLSD